MLDTAPPLYCWTEKGLSSQILLPHTNNILCNYWRPLLGHVHAISVMFIVMVMTLQTSGDSSSARWRTCMLQIGKIILIFIRCERETHFIAGWVRTVQVELLSCSALGSRTQCKTLTFIAINFKSFWSSQPWSSSHGTCRTGSSAPADTSAR